MIRLDLEQGSERWMDVRCGIPTASRFDQILTPKTLKPSSSAPKYRNQLLAEFLLGTSLDFGGGEGTGFMQRGTGMEAEARAFYEMQHDLDVERVGFILRDDRKVGGSPDGFVGTAGGADFKCPALHTHIGYLLDPATLAADYRAQVQGYMYLSDRDWWDLLSYSPALPAVEVRVDRDPEFMKALDDALEVFLADLDACRERLAPYRQQLPEAA